MGAQTTLPAYICGEIRAELARQGVAQRTLAERIGISPQQLSAILAGRAGLRVDRLQAMADFLGVTTPDIYARAAERMRADEARGEAA